MFLSLLLYLEVFIVTNVLLSCRKEANAGPLTNFEVLDFLRSREEAAKDPTRVSAPLASAESKVEIFVLIFYHIYGLYIWGSEPIWPYPFTEFCTYRFRSMSIWWTVPLAIKQDNKSMSSWKSVKVINLQKLRFSISSI